jgi:hypothetical protein
MIELTICQRQKDIKYFNQIHPTHIPKIDVRIFKANITDRHICFTYKKRKEINHMMMNKYIKEQKEIKLTDPSITRLPKRCVDPNSQDLLLVRGMPIISKSNNRTFQLANNDTIEDKKIPIDKFQ